MDSRSASDPEILQAKAWIGDAVLCLFVRGWILKRYGRVSSEHFENLTSNAFLSTIGNPTRVEAEIGIIYEREGYEAAAQYIEKTILPMFEKQERKRRRQNN